VISRHSPPAAPPRGVPATGGLPHRIHGPGGQAPGQRNRPKRRDRDCGVEAAGPNHGAGHSFLYPPPGPAPLTRPVPDPYWIERPGPAPQLPCSLFSGSHPTARLPWLPALPAPSVAVAQPSPPPEPPPTQPPLPPLLLRGTTAPPPPPGSAPARLESHPGPGPELKPRDGTPNPPSLICSVRTATHKIRQ
jgi:hypothetical protein